MDRIYFLIRISSKLSSSDADKAIFYFAKHSPSI